MEWAFETRTFREMGLHGATAGSRGVDDAFAGSWAIEATPSPSGRDPSDTYPSYRVIGCRMVPMDTDRHDWAGLIAEAVATGPASAVTVVESRHEGSSVSLIFDGDPLFRPGRFGVRFDVPAREGDARWHSMARPDSPRDWAWIAAMVEVLTPYEAVSDAEIAAPDANGVRWLSS